MATSRAAKARCWPGYSRGGPGRPIWFVEDRRPTLELVRSQAALAAVRCFLVSWGYLAPGDGMGLPEGIAWLEPTAFASPWRNGHRALEYVSTMRN